jgi:oxalate decarboxylase/phosphoglucose isomerase-like protein (cupin superfamily)
LLALLTAPNEVAREALLNDSQFVFDFTHAVNGIVQGPGGKLVSALRTNFPAIIGHGVAMTLGTIDACGINLPHTHPRATEITFVVSGSFQVGFFQENGARFIGNTLQPGMATIFPQGSIHFQLNLGCDTAVFVAAFNNEDPGVQTTAQTFFGLPANVVEASLNITSVDDLAAYLPANPAIAMQQCRTACGL